MQFTYAASSVWITFEKAPFGVSWDDAGELGPGQCSWLDRKLGGSDPNRIVVTESILAPNQFAVTWSDGEVKIIQSQPGGPGQDTGQPSSLFQREELFKGAQELAREGVIPGQTSRSLQQEELQQGDQVFEHDGDKVLLVAPALTTVLEGQTLDVQNTEEGPKLFLSKEDSND